ncbi:MAG: LptA/OstA family protein [Deltaproteobacteria bacterium]
MRSVAALASALLGATKLASGFAQGPVPVRVRCDDMTVENQRSLARCEGHVVAVRRDVTLTCEHAVAHYDETGKVTELTCRGKVHVVQQPPSDAKTALPRIADGEVGHYVEAARTLELTGHAKLTQGADVLVGEPIVFFVDEDRVEARHAHLRGLAEDAVGQGAKP